MKFKEFVQKDEGYKSTIEDQCPIILQFSEKKHKLVVFKDLGHAQ